ncbi:MAG: hypothetical protein ABII22_06450 [Candidatus Micrarchaeota archaeon]
MISLSKRLSLREVIRSTGFRKSEELLLESSIRAFSHLEAMGVDKKAMIIGGFAFRLYIAELYKGRIASGAPTDLDLAFTEVPPQLMRSLRQDMLIASGKAVTFDSRQVRVSEEVTTNFPVYHLSPDKMDQLPFLDDVCIFNGRVGKIVIRPEDLQRARLLDVYIGDGVTRVDGTLRVADPGYILASVVNPDALTGTRAWRTILVLASLGKEDFKEVVERYVDIVTASGISTQELAQPLALLNDMGKRKGFADQVAQFFDGVQTKMGKILEA